MGLEAATYIDGLVATNPTGSDQKAQGDDHIRLIKAVLKATFPSAAGPIPLGGWNGKADNVLTKTADYTLLTTDDGKALYFNITAAKTLTLLAAATAGDGFVVWVQKNQNNLADLTIAPNGTETINGVNASIGLTMNEGGLLYCNGTGWIFIGMASGLPTGTRRILRTNDDALAYAGLILKRVRTGVATDGDLGTTLQAIHKDDAAAEVQVGNLGWKMVDTGAGSMDMAWYLENIIAGVISTGDRLWKGQGTYADGLTDPGQGGSNFKIAMLNGTRMAASDIIVTGTTASPGLAEHGKMYVATGAGFVLTLPDITTVFDGYKVGLRNQLASSTCVANRSSTDTIVSQGVTSLTSITLPSLSDEIWFVADKTNTRWYVRGRRSFEGAEIAVGLATNTDQAHSLGVVPKYYTQLLRCKTGELGYTAGDEVLVVGPLDQGAVQTEVGLVADATNLSHRQGLGGNVGHRVENKTTPSTLVAITAAKWAYVLRAVVYN